MNKAEFLAKLKEKISDLPYSEVEKTLDFYSESIDDRIEDGVNEEDAINRIGDVDEIAKEIRTNLPITTLIGNKINESKQKAKSKTLWMVLAICGFPLWLPLGIAFAAVIFAVYITLWAVIFSLFAAVFSFAIAGAAGIAGGIVWCFVIGMSQGFMMIGAAVALIGLFIITIKPLFWIVKKIIKLTGTFLKKVKQLFVSKEVAK